MFTPSPDLEERLGLIFKHLHENPEISWKETETTEYIANLLKKEKISFRKFDDCTGLVAEIGSGKPVVAIRADIDALWQEVDGKFQANHSCGHDAHMTIVIGTLLTIKEQVREGTVRFIFQPAEEKGNGALAMITRGVIQDVHYLFGVHLRPIEEVPFGKAAPSIRHGAVLFLKGEITGNDAHGARPHQGVNAIDVMTALNQQLKTIYLSPFDPYSIKMTKMQAGGESFNIIPGSGEFALDVRAHSNSLLQNLQKKVVRVIHGVASTFDVNIDYEWTGFTPGAEVALEAEGILQEAILDVLGQEGLAPPVVTPGSDDFHFYTIKEPQVKAAMLGLGADLTPGLHHPNMIFDHRAIPIGVKILSTAILKGLQSK
ncbi:amidohydrolase [Oikeobacillus pervagus]|uniref:Amidohydrolase n=1 Tax=Oikeobacillus pervagus TaxID=1325931 RepID=A0AAJ1SWN3_9BACI|nr:M20 peptidase aminoacylase family protein [Oikeobacillus pervagus]MDQ0214105.1 amidohydrolase [Oikeobacillus pervagus]